MNKFSKMTLNLEGQKMFQILAKAKELEAEGKDIVHFEIGDPDFSTPNNIVDKCVESLRKGNTHYTFSSGLPEFKRVASELTLNSRGFKPDSSQILVTQGGNIQIYYVMACTVDPGDEVITFDPCFVSYKSIMNILGINPVFVPLREENNFRVNPDEIEKFITSKTRMILINSPHNPTGSVLTESEMLAIYEIAKKHDLYLVSDEVYGRMVYETDITKFASPSKYDQCKERTVIIHSFSKSYAMTGWRIGAITGPVNLVEKMSLLLEATTSCVAPFIQEAAIEAMSSSQEFIAEMIGEYKKRRDLMVGYLNQIKGVSCLLPDGAFYAFANIKKTGLSDVDFSRYVLEEVGVATCPGSFFGAAGEGYVRFCYANSMENISRGMIRVRNLFNAENN